MDLIKIRMHCIKVKKAKLCVPGPLPGKVEQVASLSCLSFAQLAQELVAEALRLAFPHQFQPSRIAECDHPQATLEVESGWGLGLCRRGFFACPFCPSCPQKSPSQIWPFLSVPPYRFRPVFGRTAATTCCVGRQMPLATTSCRAW